MVMIDGVSVQRVFCWCVYVAVVKLHLMTPTMLFPLCHLSRLTVSSVALSSTKRYEIWILIFSGIC